MKYAILGLSLVLSSAATATFLELPANTVGIYSIDGDVIGTEAMCPRGVTCVTNGTVVSLKYTLGGCLDTMASHVYEVVGKTVVVHAQAAANEASKVTRCRVAPTALETVVLPGVYKPFTIKFLGTGKAVNVK